MNQKELIVFEEIVSLMNTIEDPSILDRVLAAFQSRMCSLVPAGENCSDCYTGGYANLCMSITDYLRQKGVYKRKNE